MSGRPCPAAHAADPWSASDESRLRRWWGNIPTAAIAARLGRTAHAVRHRAAALTLPRPLRRGERQDARIAELTLAGRSNAEIAAELGLGEMTTRNRRKRMGVALSESQMSLIRSAAGKLGGGKQRSEEWAAWKRDRGWPASLTLSAVVVIEHLCDHGPQTMRRISAGTGLSVNAAGLIGAGGSRGATATLIRHGLAHAVAKGVSEDGRHVAVYFPSLAAVAARQAFLARQPKDATK